MEKLQSDDGAMTVRDAAIKLVEIRKRWRNNGSTIEFSKSEMKVFQDFREANPQSWETEWPTVQLAAHKIVP